MTAGARAVPPQGGPVEDLAARAELAARLRVAVARLARRARLARPGGLTASQLSALVAIESRGEARVGDLAAMEGIAAPTMTRVVAGLVEAGLVERRADPDDGRSIRVRLSPDGTGHLERLRCERTTALIRAIEQLDPADYARLEAAVPVLESLLDGPDAPQA